MAKLTLDIESNGLGVFSAMTSKMDELSNNVDAFGKDGKDAFKKVTDEAGKLTDEVVNGAKQTSKFADESTKLAKTGNIYRQLTKEIKNLETQAYAAEKAGNKAFGDELRIKAGKLRDKLGDLNKEAQALNGNMGENLARAAGKTTSLIATGYEGILSAQILVGDKSKEFEETLLKLQALNGIARVAQEFAGISDILTEIKLGATPVIHLFTNGASSIVSGYSSANESLKGFFTNFGSNAKAAFVTAGGFLKDFGKNAGSVAKNIGTGFVSFFANFGTNMKSFAKSAKAGIDTIGTAIKNNPLGIILTVITLVITAMVLLRNKVKPIADLFEFLGKVIDEVGREVEQFMQQLGLMDSESEKRAKRTVDNTQKEVDAIRNRYDKEIALVEAAGGKTSELEEKKYKATLDRVIKTISILKAKRLMEGHLSEEEVKQFEEAEKMKSEIIQEFVVNRAKDQKAERDKEEAARKEALQKQKEAADKAKQLRKDLEQSLLDLAKRAQAAEIEMATGEEKLQKQKAASEAELALLRKTIFEKGKLTDRNFKFSAEQEAEFGKLQLQINQKYANDIIALEIEKANRLADVQRGQADDNLKFLELQAKLRIAAVQKLQTPKGVSEETFELEKQRNILIIQKQAAQEQLEFKIKALEAEANAQIIADQNEVLSLFGKNDELSNIKRANAEANIQQTKDNLALETNVLKAETDVQISELGKQIQEATDKLNSKGKLIDWQKLLGLDDKQFAQLTQAMGQMKEELQKASDAVFELLNQQLDAESEKLTKELDVIQQRKDARDNEIHSLEDNLSEQIKLADQGLANNVDRIKEELAAKEAARQRDLADEQRLQEEQKKLQAEKKRLAKIQFAMDTALQASNLITAVSEVFATYAEVPYVAAALAALMVGAFVATKAAAYKAINQGGSQNNFKDGVIDLQGPGTKTSDSISANLSVGESVMTADETEEYYDLLMGIRKKDKGLIESGILNLIKGTGVVITPEISRGLAEQKQTLRISESRGIFVSDNSGVEKRLETVDNSMQKLIKKSDDQTIVMPNGDIMIKKGNLTQIIRNNGK